MFDVNTLRSCLGLMFVLNQSPRYVSIHIFVQHRLFLGVCLLRSHIGLMYDENQSPRYGSVHILVQLRQPLLFIY